MNTSDLCTVHDTEALGDIVDAMVYVYGADVESVAGAKIGISQPTLNRLRHRMMTQITRATAVALERAAKAMANDDAKFADLPRDLRAAIISPETQRYHAGYVAWCDERKTRWQERDGATWKVGMLLQLDVDLAPPVMQAPLRQEMVRLLWQRVHHEYPDIFHRFRDEMVRRGVDETRQEVAVLRVIEPLLEASQSAYIERSYSELTERERRDFIDAGIKRELILLDREPALTRASRIAEEGADTFAKQEGKRALYANERASSAPPNPA